MISRRIRLMGLALASVALLCPIALGQAARADEAAVVLDTSGFWRIHNTLSRPVMQAQDGLKTIPSFDPKARGHERELAMWQDTLLAAPSAKPAAEWWQQGFDDSSWVRAPAAAACRSPYLEQLCLRSQFKVTDPAKIKGLRLELKYHGGAVVYVNGKEMARKHFPKDASLADAYPAEAFVGEDGKLIAIRGEEILWTQAPSAETKARIASRERKLSVEISAADLQQGANTIAVELRRAAYDKAVGELLAPSKNHGLHGTFDLSWNTCEVRQVQLLAADAAGLIPNATRPNGFQIWNSDPMATDFDLDFGDRGEAVRPIQLTGAVNGTYSGKVVVGSSAAIHNLSATASELKGDGGIIPAAQVRIRYAMPWGNLALTHSNSNQFVPYPAEPTPLLAIYDHAPKEIPVYAPASTPRCLKLPNQPRPVFGAVVPVWVTVKVPADARPGTYHGQVTITADGLSATSVPLNLELVDFKLPDPVNWRTWVELIQSPDTLQLEYGYPAWSEKHWQMINKSMEYLAAVGSKVLYVPLIAQSNAGNAESMVHWIKKGNDQYDYDFSTMNKYLDVAEKHIGKPAVVVFNVWDRYLMRDDSSGRDFQIKNGLKVADKGPIVTVDGPDGKATNVTLPDFSDPSSRALWKPLFDQLHEQMRKRGLESTMQLGMVSDFWVGKSDVLFLEEITGKLPWANAAHTPRNSLYPDAGPVGYQSTYFGARFGLTASMSGWKRPDLQALFERVPLDNYPICKWRLIAEQSITGNVRGVGRLGADAWLVVKDKRGDRRGRAWERYPGSNWGYLNCNNSVLAPSPEGPVATMRFEELREGAQECEAIIVLEKALGDKTAVQKLGPELAKAAQACLDERRDSMWRAYGVYQSGADYSHELSSWRERTSATGYTWYLGSGWQQRSAKLYRLAGQVSRKLGENDVKK